MSDTPIFNFKTKLSADEVISIASAMHHVAKADGVHPAEEEMILEFVAAVGSDLGEDLVLVPMDPATLAESLGDPQVRRLAMQSLVLLAMADGKLSPEEDALNQKYAEALGLKAEFKALSSQIVTMVQSGDAASLFV